MIKFFKRLGYVFKNVSDLWNNSTEVLNEVGEKKAAVNGIRNDGIPSLYSLVSELKWGIKHSLPTIPDEPGELVIHSYTFPYAEVAMFVTNVFCARTGENLEDFGLIYKPIIDDNGSLLHTKGTLLMSKEMFPKFTAWLDEYKKRFDDGYDFKTILPAIQDRSHVSAYFVEHNCNFTSRHGYAEHEDKQLLLPCDEMYDEWLWMLEHTTGKVRATSSMWAFEEDHDAMMYQLQLR